MKRFCKFIVLSLIVTLLSCSCTDQTQKYRSIFDAIRAGDIKALRAFIKKDPSLLKQIDDKSKYKGSPLFETIVLTAPRNPNDNITQKLVPNIDSKICWDMIMFLIKKGADVNFKNDLGETSLQIAAAYGHKDLVAFLLDNGADINLQCSAGWSPLHQTAMKGKKNVAEYLIHKGANININDKEGNTPLHSAAGYGHTEIVEVLIANGAEVNAKNKSGRTPLDYSIMGLNKDTKKLLVAKGGLTTLSRKDLREFEYLLKEREVKKINKSRQ